jgi:hypothetical protein
MTVLELLQRGLQTATSNSLRSFRLASPSKTTRFASVISNQYSRNMTSDAAASTESAPAPAVIETIATTTATTESNGVKRRKLQGREFYESIGSPKTIVAPMVEQSEFVRLLFLPFFLPIVFGFRILTAHPIGMASSLPPSLPRQYPLLHPHVSQPPLWRVPNLPNTVIPTSPHGLERRP